jgi:hypothetical protein
MATISKAKMCVSQSQLVPNQSRHQGHDRKRMMTDYEAIVNIVLYIACESD